MAEASLSQGHLGVLGLAFSPEPWLVSLNIHVLANMIFFAWFFPQK